MTRGRCFQPPPRLLLVLACLVVCTGAGTITLAPPAPSFSEADIRTPGVTFTLTIGGDAWAAGQQAAIVAGLRATGTDLTGFENRKTTATVVAISGLVMTVRIGPDPFFDTSVSDTVAIDMPALAVASATKPVSSGGQLVFTITPAAGVLSTVLLINGVPATPPVVSEALLNTNGVVELAVTLANGERWKTLDDNSDRLSLLEGMTADGTQPEGWEDRKTVVLPSAQAFKVTNARHLLTLRLRPDAGFNVDSAETVTSNLPGPSYPSTLFLSNIPPGGQPFRFSITPSAGVVTLLPSPLVRDEAQLRNGGVTFTLRLSAWERWAQPVDVPGWVAAMTSAQNTAASWNVRRATLLPGSGTFVVGGGGRDMVVTLAADAAYDIFLQESVVITPPAASVASGIQPTTDAGSPPVLVITPTAAAWTMAFASGTTTLTEDQVVAGGQKLRITLSGDTFSANACTEVIANMVAPPSPAGFLVRRVAVLGPSASCTVTGSTMDLTFAPDALFDIASPETVTVTLPAAALASGLPPTPPSLTFLITPSQGTISLSPTVLTERELASGTAVITITLAGGETWVQGKQTAIVDAFVSQTDPLTGFNARRSLLLDPSTITMTPKVVTVPVKADAVYDIAAQESVRFLATAHLFASSVAPPGDLSVTVTPVRAALTLAPATFTEGDVRSGGVSFTLSLATQETWLRTDAVKAGLVASLSAALAGVPSGFAAHRASLVATHLVSFDLAQRGAIIKFAPQPLYDITNAEEVSLGVSPDMFASNLQPEVASALKITITPEAGLVSLLRPSVPCYTEEDVREGRVSLALTLSAGETWTNLAAIIPTVSSNASCPTCFAGRRATLLPVDGSSLTLDAASAGTLRFTLRPDPTYDLRAPEFITIGVPAAAVASGVAPRPNTSPGYADPFGFCVVPSRAAVAGGIQVFPETDIRSGGACLTMELGAGETWNAAVPRETWLDAMVLETVATPPPPAQPAGWAHRKPAIVPAASSISGSTNVMCFAADSLFDITANETVRVTIPPAALGSGLSPAFPVYFRVAVAPGAVRMAPPPDHAEGSVRLGGTRLTLLLEDEEWVDPPPAAALAAGFGCGGTEAAGFNARRERLLNGASFVVNAGELRVHLAQDSGFDIEVREDCTVALPPAATPSGVVPVGDLRFSINPSTVYNAAGQAGFTDVDIQTGTASLELTVDNDQWAAAGDAVFVAAVRSASPETAEPNGFNARKSRILPVSALQFVSDHVLRLVLVADPGYQNCADEAVTLDVPGAAVQSGRPPSVVPRGGTLTFTVARTRATSARLRDGTALQFTIREEALRNGGAAAFAFDLTLAEGEWAPGAGRILLEQSLGSLNGTNSWNVWRSQLLEAEVVGSTLRFVARGVPRFDVAEKETVVIELAEEALGCGTLPAGQREVVLTITPSPGTLTVDCGAQNGFLFTDHEVRSGAVSVALRLTGEEWASDYEALHAGIVADATDPPNAVGFNALKSSLLLVPGSFQQNDDGTTLDIAFQPVAQYRVTGPEVIRISLPLSMIESGLPPIVQGCPLILNVLPGRGRVTASPLYATDDMVRQGGFRLTLNLQGDDWAPNIDAAAFLSGFTAKALSGTQNPDGFDAQRNDILKVPGSFVQEASNPRQLVVVFGQARGYSLGTEEELQLAVSNTDVVGLQPVVGSPVKLLVTLGKQRIRFATANSLFTAEGQTRTADVSRFVDPIVIEVVDSRGNVDPTLSSGLVTVTAGGAGVELRNATAPLVKGVATFDTLRILTPVSTELTFTADTATGIVTRVLRGNIQASGSPAVTPTPGATPPLPPKAVLAPIPLHSACNASVVLDARRSSNPAQLPFSWSTTSTSTVLQDILLGRTSALVPVGAGVEEGDHQVCVNLGATLQACRTLTVRAPGRAAVLIEEGTLLRHPVQTPLALHALPLNGTTCSYAERDDVQSYSYSWVSTHVFAADTATARSTLHVAANRMVAGEEHAFTVTACALGAAECGMGRIIIVGVDAPLRATLSADALSLGTRAEARLNAAAVRGVDTPAPGYSVRWACSRCSADSANPDAGGSGSPVVLRRDAFKTGGHDVTVTVTQGGDEANATVSLEVTNHPYSVVIVSPSHPGQNTVPASSLYSLEADVLPNDAATNATPPTMRWVWQLDPPATGGMSQQAGLLAIPSLAPATSYEAAVSGGPTARAARRFSTLPQPSGGGCTATPAAGARVALVCSGFASATAYRYVRVLGSVGAARDQDISGGWRALSRYTTFVPSLGEASHRFAVDVRDASGSVARVEGLQVPAFGQEPPLNAASAMANGDYSLATMLLAGAIQAGQGGGAASQVGRTAYELVEAAQTAGEVAQAGAVMCAVGDQVDALRAATQATLEDLARAVLLHAQKLVNLGGVSADARSCAVKAVGAVSMLTAATLPASGVPAMLADAMSAVLSAGPRVWGEATEVVEGPDVSAVMGLFKASPDTGRIAFVPYGTGHPSTGTVVAIEPRKEDVKVCVKRCSIQ